MNRAPQVSIQGLSVTAAGPMTGNAIFLPAQVCDMAELQAGEVVQVHNLSTGRCFLAELRRGGSRHVQVNGSADPDLMRGDRLRVIAGECWVDLRPGFCTSCLCENNAIIEYRHFTATHFAREANETAPAKRHEAHIV